jgi:hypothetical protein
MMHARVSRFRDDAVCIGVLLLAVFIELAQKAHSLIGAVATVTAWSLCNSWIPPTTSHKLLDHRNRPPRRSPRVYDHV